MEYINCSLVMGAELKAPVGADSLLTEFNGYQGNVAYKAKSRKTTL
jgi:hypothetical protein